MYLSEESSTLHSVWDNVPRVPSRRYFSKEQK
jgi:hypothetical protein